MWLQLEFVLKKQKNYYHSSFFVIMNHMRNKYIKGFTVLEFLIVVAIIMILIAIILPNLQLAREKSFDEKRVTDLKTISLELEQFKQACGSYPPKIDALVPCGNDNNPDNNLGRYIPEIEQYNFSDLLNPNYISYAPFSVSISDPICVAFHLGITLQNKTIGIFANSDSNVNSATDPNFVYVACPDSIGNTAFNGTDEHTYDIFKQ